MHRCFAGETIARKPRLSNLAGLYVAEQSDAAFLFGACVGLDLAALTFCHSDQLPAVRRAMRKR